MAVVVIKQKELEKKELLQGFESLEGTRLPNCVSTLDIPYMNGKHITGLDSVPDKKKEFETFFGVNFDSPEGIKFLDNFQININHDSFVLNTENMEHAFIYQILIANDGLGLISFNEEEWSTEPFVAEDKELEMKSKVDKLAVEAEAMSTLLTLRKKTPAKMFNLAKYIFDTTAGILNEDIAFTKLYEYLTTGNKFNNSNEFLAILREDFDLVDTTVYVKEAISKHIIRSNNGTYENYVDRTKLGRNLTEIVNFLRNPQNVDILGDGTATDKVTSIRAQLKNRDKTGLY